MSASEPLREEYVPVEFVDTTNLPEKEWLAWRRKGIGGSDAAAIMGISPFRTARDIYYDKLNIAPQENSEENWVALKMGHLLEDLVAEIFSHKTGLEVLQIKRMFQHPLHKFMLADVDYFVSLQREVRRSWRSRPRTTTPDPTGGWRGRKSSRRTTRRRVATTWR